MFLKHKEWLQWNWRTDLCIKLRIIVYVMEAVKVLAWYHTAWTCWADGGVSFALCGASATTFSSCKWAYFVTVIMLFAGFYHQPIAACHNTYSVVDLDRLWIVGARCSHAEARDTVTRNAWVSGSYPQLWHGAFRQNKHRKLFHKNLLQVCHHGQANSWDVFVAEVCCVI